MNNVPISQLKNEVRQLFENRWSIAIKICLGFYLLNILFSLINTPGQITDNDVTANLINQYTGTNGVILFLFNAIITFATVGVQYSFLDWLRTNQPVTNPIASGLQTFSRKYFTSTLAIYLIKMILTFLWGLLFLIPGIIKNYSYSMAFFIYKDHIQSNPDISFLDCITESRKLMNGHKMDLFLLQLSFIGWYLLGLITFGIGLIWVIPYKDAANANFYRHLVE